MLRFLGIYPVAILLAVVTVGYVSKHGLIAPQAKPVPVAPATLHSYAATPAQAPAALAPATFAPTTQIVEGDRTGHYVTPVEIDGREFHMLIDTGADLVALRSEDADEIGLRPSPSDFTLRIQTANGLSTAAHTWLKHVRVGMVEVHDVEAIIMAPGASARSLLGMSFLSKLRHFGASDGKMRLEQ